MLTGIHFLLTYTCNYECDHCFLYCGPRAEGVFTVGRIRMVIEEARRIGTIESVYFEGGEPFLYHPLLVEGLRQAQEAGFETGVVTNCYWATAEEDARIWLGPVVEAGITDLSLSDDAFHHGADGNSPTRVASRAAGSLGVEPGSICIGDPTVEEPSDAKGQPVVGGGVLFKGRAVDKLAKGLPTRTVGSMVECRHEELVAPERVHVDPFGMVHVCQGVSIGNMWERPLSEIVAGYRGEEHPICGPLVRGGPAELARSYGVEVGDEFIDECHYCYQVRRALLDRFPEQLGPRQVYGL